jgi:alkylation response protein AidB-like acyl-CoA dehydrogenase
MTTVKALRRDAGPIDRLTPLLPGFAAAAAEHDASETFVAENYALLRAARLMSAGVPVELGGDGLEVPELGRLLTTMARSCSSTALAFAMHTHSVAVLAWRWRNQKAPVEAVLKRVADEQIVIATSGGFDWLESSGKARKVDGGYAIDAVKGFASGSPTASLLNTTAICDDPENGPTVIHFMLPLNAKEVRIEDAWRAMGMRATASNLIHIAGFVVPDDKVALKRPKGKWHPLYHAIAMVAFPLIYSVYLGVAEAMRDHAVATAKRRPPTPQLVDLVGEVETDLAAARFAIADMIATSGGTPGVETTNRICLGRSNFVSAAMRLAGNALELTAGGGYMRAHPVERLFRDIQAARFHPLMARTQRDFAGRVALGLDVDGPLNASAA